MSICPGCGKQITDIPNPPPWFKKECLGDGNHSTKNVATHIGDRTQDDVRKEKEEK